MSQVMTDWDGGFKIELQTETVFQMSKITRLRGDRDAEYRTTVSDFGVMYFKSMNGVLQGDLFSQWDRSSVLKLL